MEDLAGLRRGSALDVIVTHASRRYWSVADRRLQLAVVATDALAGLNRANGRSAAPAVVVLEVRRTFEPSRLGAACLAAAYAQVVPIHQRRLARVNKTRTGVSIDGVRDIPENAVNSEGGR